MMSETIPSTTITMAIQDDDFDTSDDNDGPSGIRWAPVGANDGDSDFNDDYKSSDYKMERTLSYNMDRLKLLEEEQEMLNSSLIALTTHFAQVQFRLRQIVDAPTNEKESLLKELEEFAFRGIPDVPSSMSLKNKLCNSIMESTSSIYDTNDKNDKNDTDVQLKIDKQKTKQRELIEQLKIQLEDLEKYAYETDGQDLPQSVVLERQNLIINHLKEKLNFDIDDLCKLPIDDLRWQVDDALNNLVSPLKMKEQLVNQLKTQVADLERFIHYLQGEVSNDTLACTCACPIHLDKIKSSSSSSSSPSSRRDIDNSTNNSKTINTVKKVITLLHIYLLSQLGCSSNHHHHHDGQKKSKITWKDLRTRLDISIEHVLDIVDENNKSIDNNNSDYYEDDDDDDDNDIFISGQMKKKTNNNNNNNNNNKLTGAVRKHLSICLRDLMQHGLCSNSNVNSVVPFVGCFPHKKTTINTIHVWQIIVKYYEYKNGHRYCSSTAQKLSQSFNLDLVNDRCVSTKQSLLVTIGNIIASHTPYKRSFNSHFKAFVCAALNANKLVVWLKLILQCQYLLENHYASWSYVVKTGFQDAFYALDRLTNVKFELPVDLAVRQFTNIKDAF